MDSKNLERCINIGNLTVKRKPGRPRKIHSHNIKAEEMVNSSNEKVPSSDNLPEFFKIYMPALCSEMLRIPPDFIDKFCGDIPTTCTLKRPWGASWQVDVNKMNDCWFFQKGWPQFVEQNSIEESDFLTFCYLGKSVFLVKVFSPNGCPKGSGHASKSDDDESSESENSEEINGSKPQKVSRWGSSVGEINGNPFFSIKMQKTYMNGRAMCVPLEFWSAHMREHESSETATLWVENHSWSVELVTTVPGRVLFRRASKFLMDNSLKVGNVCTFQLIDPGSLSFKVTFRR